MIASDLPLPDLNSDFSETVAAAPKPELGDAIDSIEDAAVTMGRIVCNEAESVVDDLRGLIREKPIETVAWVGGVAYLLGRLMR